LILLLFLIVDRQVIAIHASIAYKAANAEAAAHAVASVVVVVAAAATILVITVVVVVVVVVVSARCADETFVVKANVCVLMHVAEMGFVHLTRLIRTVHVVGVSVVVFWRALFAA